MVDGSSRTRRQALRLGGLRVTKEDPRDDSEPILYFLAGRKLYVVGAQNGEYPLLGWRRTGFVLGKRVEEERQRAAHLLNEMGGLWAQPIKVLDGFHYSIEDGEGTLWHLTDSDSFDNYLSHVQFTFRCEGFTVLRRDFVDEEEPVLFSRLSLTNETVKAQRLTLHLRARVNVMPAWFAGWPNGREEVGYDEVVGAFVAFDALWPNRWAVAFGSEVRPMGHDIAESDGKKTVHATFEALLAGGETRIFSFLFVAENQHGVEGARARFVRLRGSQHRRLRDKVDSYRRVFLGAPSFRCSDAELQSGFVCAKANLRLLEADLPKPLGRYFFAGVPEYVQLFGTDTCYSVPGLVAAGLLDTTGDALRLLRKYADQMCGRVPHEVTTNGRVFHPGGAQETPQFAIACWNYFRWTADRAFLEEVYPLCAEGLLDYVVAHWDADLDFYPDGPSMIERKGADEENVDSVSYFCHALFCLSHMAAALGDDESARRYEDSYARILRTSLNQDFWNEGKAIFADSLREDHSQRTDGYWTVVVPLETGLADAEKAEKALTTLTTEDGWLLKDNGVVQGLVHTRIVEPTVWTLPTGILARIAFCWGYSELGVDLLRSIARTALNDRKRGALGMFEELIPEGLSFLQLWSPAIFIQGVVEGLFGFSPLAHLDQLQLFPRPPADWTSAEIEGVQIGDRKVSVSWRRDRDDHLVIHHDGGRPMRYVLRWFASDDVAISTSGDCSVQVSREKSGSRDILRIEFELDPGRPLEIIMRVVNPH